MPTFTVQQYTSAGRIEIVGSADPISLQASPARKAVFRSALARAVTESSDFIFTGDVEVTIQWFISPRRRYGTHIVADIDNVIKPILDALTGPEVLLIDDNQVQSLRAYWLDPAGDGMRVSIEVRASDLSEIRQRAGLFFVEFPKLGCMPFPSLPKEQIRLLVDSVSRRLVAWQEQLDKGIDESVADALLPIARFYPRARLRHFKVVHAAEFMAGED